MNPTSPGELLKESAGAVIADMAPRQSGSGASAEAGRNGCRTIGRLVAAGYIATPAAASAARRDLRFDDSPHHSVPRGGLELDLHGSGREAEECPDGWRHPSAPLLLCLPATQRHQHRVGGFLLHPAGALAYRTDLLWGR